jgi:hypothetical protein
VICNVQDLGVRVWGLGFRLTVAGFRLPAGVGRHGTARDGEAEEDLCHCVHPRVAVRDGCPPPLPQVKL